MRRVTAALCAVVFVAVALAVSEGSFRAGRSIARSDIEVPLDVLEPVDAGLALLAEAPNGPGQHRVAFLGDSMVVGYRAGHTVPERLQEVLDRGPVAGRFRIHTVAAPGMGPFDFYFIADRVAAARPDQVILPLNLTAFSRGWRETFSRPQLAGVLPASRIPQALVLPLDGIGMTADRLIGYVTVVKLGGLDAWRELSQEQARLGSARTRGARLVGESLGSGADKRFAVAAANHFTNRFNLPGGERLTPEAIQLRYGTVLRGIADDDPTLRVLAASIRIFRDAGIDVLVYASPTNVEHFARVGVEVAGEDAQGLGNSLTTIDRTVTRAGGRFVDLHDLVGDSGFRDAAGHLKVKGDQLDGALLLVRSLVPPLVQESRKRSGGN